MVAFSIRTRVFVLAASEQAATELTTIRRNIFFVLEIEDDCFLPRQKILILEKKDYRPFPIEEY